MDGINEKGPTVSVGSGALLGGSYIWNPGASNFLRASATNKLSLANRSTKKNQSLAGSLTAALSNHLLPLRSFDQPHVIAGKCASTLRASLPKAFFFLSFPSPIIARTNKERKHLTS